MAKPEVFNDSLWWCFTFLCSIAVSFSSNNLWQFHHFFFLNRLAIGISACWGTWARQVPAFWNWSSAFIVWKGPFDIQDCNPVWASKPSSSLSPKPANGICDYNPCLARHFASTVVNQLCNNSSSSSSYLVCADHPLAHWGFVAVIKWGHMTRNCKVPGCESGWNCSPITAPKGGRAGWKHWGEAAVLVIAGNSFGKYFIINDQSILWFGRLASSVAVI